MEQEKDYDPFINNLAEKYISLIKNDIINIPEYNPLEKNNEYSNIQEKELNYKRRLFEGKAIPEISIYDYLKRIKQYGKCTNETMITSFIHINILINKRMIRLTYYNIHRLLVVSIMISNKFFEDDYYDNKWWASIGGISLKEINVLEIEYCDLIEYNFYIKSEDYKKNETLFYK
jgi:hypothetical protein